MSDPVRPHRRQPTRLPRPWDSPGKNTGVGCRFLLQCRKVKSESEVAQLCPTLSDPTDCSPPGSSVHGIFQATGLEWGAIAFSSIYFIEPYNREGKVTEGWTRLSDLAFTFHFSLSCIGEGNGNPLHCSCLENPRDGGAWWAAVCGITQSQTQLKRLSSSSNVFHG